MNEERKTELGNLLGRAVHDIGEPSFGANMMRILELIPISEYKSQASSQNQNMRNYMEFSFHRRIQNNALKENLIDFIDDALPKHAHSGKIEVGLAVERVFKEYNVWHPITSDSILWRLLQLSVFRGIKKAVRGFESLVEEKWVPFQHMAVMLGIKIEGEIQVYDGIRLIPTPSKISELPGYLPIYPITEYEKQKLCSKTIISVDYSGRILFNKSGKACPPSPLGKLRSVDREYFSIETFSIILSLVCNHAIQPSTLWEHCDIDEYLLASPITCSMFYPYRERWNSTPDISITYPQIQNAKYLYDKHNRLSTRVISMISVAIRRWIEAKIHLNPVDKIIDYGIALESLYCNEDDERNISAKLSRRAAKYLANNEREEKDLKETFKYIYNARSKAVHTGKLVNVSKPEKIVSDSGFTNQANDLCLKSIIKIIESGEIPDRF